MSETEKRVTLSLVFATDENAGIVQAAVLQKLGEVNKLIVSSSVYVFDPGTVEPEQARVHEVHSVDERGRAAVMYRLIDGDRADEIARNIGGLVVQLPVLADHRKPHSAGLTPDHDPKFCVLCQSGGHPAQPEPLIDPDCVAGKCSSCIGGPCEHGCHRAGLPVDRTFEITADHITLLRAAHWSSGEGTPGIDSKRPYGSSSVFTDLCRLLIPGWKQMSTEEADTVSAANEDALWETHEGLATVMAIATDTLTLQPGTYAHTENGWRHATAQAVPLIDPKCPVGTCASCTGAFCHQPETAP